MSSKRLCGCRGTCDHGDYCRCFACQIEPVSDEPLPQVKSPRRSALRGTPVGSRPPLPPVNPLLAATIDDEPAVSLTAHPYYAVDCPVEAHLDPDGMCACTADCCCDPVTDLCSCPDCGGTESGCPDHA